MNSLQKVQVEKMRASGTGFKEISEKINIPVKAIVDTGNALMRGLGTPGKVALSSTHESGKVYLCCTDDFSPTDREKEKYSFGEREKRIDYISPMVRRIIHKQQKCHHSVALLDRRSMLSKPSIFD